MEGVMIVIKKKKKKKKKNFDEIYNNKCEACIPVNTVFNRKIK
jgi:translation initiation factor 2 beta subunit (eIF-2beta)/eIF-5